MKTLVSKDTNISLYLWADSVTVNIGSESTVVGDPSNPDFIIADCNTSNATLHSSVDNKSDWYGWKYKHDGSAWSTNADWVGRRGLRTDINDSVTTIDVGNSNAFTASGTVQIDDEKITYTGVDGTNLTGCTRGAASTSAASHTASSSVTQVA
tara:strand:- start:421 stop:879 length:459 start_codon:yes stop_codon:yes gene_type:complete